MSRVQLEISLSRLTGNARAVMRHVSPCRVMAVLKADAYGLGAVPIAGALVEAGVSCFGVADIAEARDLVKLGLPVHMLGGMLPQEVPEAAELGVVCPVTDVDIAERISSEGVRLGRALSVEFLVDTGMGRLGIPVSEAAPVIQHCLALPGVSCRGIYSHFPVAYRAGESYTQQQVAAFRELLAAFPKEAFQNVHMANSDGVNNVHEAMQPPFNMVRTGINLYGAYDIEGDRRLALEDVLSLKSVLVAVRTLPEGACIGYGCTCRLAKSTRVGTVPVGYADGMPLALSNRGHVLVGGRVCPILGRVSMDYTTVDLSQVPDAVPGDEVTCLGGEGPTAVSVEDWARLKGTHPYDIICSFGKRVERRYI